MIALVLILILLSSVSAEMRQTAIFYGSNTMRLVFAPPDTPDVKYMHTFIDGDTVIVIPVTTGKSNTIVCRQSQTTQIIVAPRGCDSPIPGQSIEHSNCALGGLLAEAQAAATLREQWSYRRDSIQCTAPESCLGPVWLKKQGWVPEDGISDLDLISAKGLFLVSGLGPVCEIPVVTAIEVELPQLNLTVNGCPDSLLWDFNGIYEPYYHDAVVNYSYVFRRQFAQTQQRILMYQYEDGYQVILASDFVLKYESIQLYPNPMDVISTLVNFTDNCSAYFGLIPAPRPLSIVGPAVVDDLNYLYNDRDTYESSVCGFGVGELTIDLLYKYPQVPEGVVFGGFPVLRNAGITGYRFKVRAQYEYRDFVEGCERFYPKSETFYGYTGVSGPLYNREAPAEYSCFTPFLINSLIDSATSVIVEKAKQCQMMGCVPGLSTQDICRCRSWATYCRKGFFYFDQRCYYKPDVYRDTSYQVPQSQADSACRAIHPEAIATSQTTVYLLEWLQDYFVFFNQQQSGFPTRLFLSGKRCRCYDYSDNQTLVATITECNCDKPNFPLCSYHIKDDYINLPNADPNTLTILRDGQDGVAFNGKQITCTCVAGSAGQYCNLRTCYPRLSASFNTSDPFQRFFAQCYLQQSGNEQSNGNCDDQNPNDCFCNQGYGPPSRYGDNYTTIPCAVPSATEPLSKLGFTVNGITYFDTRYGVCNTRMAGVGYVNAATGYGWCECNTRINMDPNALVKVEKAWDGRSCTGRVAMLMPDGFLVNGDIKARFCNGHGTVCPTGERLGEQRLDGSYVIVLNRDACYDDDGKLLNQCVCDDGYDGVSCTAPVPNNILVDVPVQIKDRITYVALDLRSYVSHVIVQPSADCVVTNVTVADTLFDFPQCAYNTTGKRWECDRWGSFISVFVSNSNPVCYFSAYTDDFPICGFNTNPYAARFFANEVYRAYLYYTEPQPLRFAKHGSTNTECFCDPNHTGRRCGVGVSSYRTDPDGGTTARVCGETTSPQRGVLNEDQSECVCQKIGNYLMGGHACECAWYEGYNGTVQECGGHGRCVAPSFPYGYCEFDLLDWQEDALYSPFSNVAPLERDDPIYAFYPVGDTDSIVVINNVSWFLSYGQLLTIPTLSGPLDYCYSDHRFPINITYVCEGEQIPPQRAVSNITIRTEHCGEYECRYTDTTELCDLASTCSITNFCDNSDYPCINEIFWIPDTENGETLVSGTYPNSWIMCANATQTNQQAQAAPYGIFDCSNFVDRFIDIYHFIAGNVNQTQCGDEPITLYSNVLGWMYGGVWNAINNLLYTGTWIDDNYEALASLMSGYVCVKSNGDYDEDVLDDDVLDKYGISVVSVGPEQFVQFSNDTSNPLYPLIIRNSTAYFFNGLYGNPMYHEINIRNFPNITTDGFTFHTRPGYSVIIPQLTTTTEFRELSIRFRESVYGFQVYGPSGRVCTTMLRLFEPGSVATADCINAFAAEPFYVSMQRFLNQSTNATVLAQAFMNYTQNYVLWYWPVNQTDEPIFYESDFQITSRNSSYNGLYDLLRDSIIVKHRFPRNLPFEEACLERNSTLREFNLSVDKPFVRNVHTTYLAPRRCSKDKECQKFARNPEHFRCILDNAPKRSWVNGPVVEEIIGDEGGCEVAYDPGIRDSQTFGSTCVAGYTPNDAQLTWFAIQDYQNYILARYPNFTEDYDDYPVYNVSEVTNVACTLPISDDSTRPIEVCGGARGVLRKSVETVIQNVTLMDGNFIRRCPEILLNGQLLTQRPFYFSLKIISWVASNTTVTTINDLMYINGTQRLLTGPCGENRCEYEGDNVIDCVPLISSATQRIRTTVNGEIRVFIKEDFFNYRII